MLVIAEELSSKRELMWSFFPVTLESRLALESTTDFQAVLSDHASVFLGVHIARNDSDGTITLRQKGLTPPERILKTLNVLGSLPSVQTPAVPNTKFPMHKDDGDPPNVLVKYESTVGQLLYLSGHTRPDIAFAEAQCARFTHNPKRQHEAALISIGQYLKGTADKGLVLSPDPDRPLDVDCYVNAKFAGLFGIEEPH